MIHQSAKWKTTFWKWTLQLVMNWASEHKQSQIQSMVDEIFLNELKQKMTPHSQVKLSYRVSIVLIAAFGRGGWGCSIPLSRLDCNSGAGKKRWSVTHVKLRCKCRCEFSRWLSYFHPWVHGCKDECRHRVLNVLVSWLRCRTELESDTDLTYI